MLIPTLRLMKTPSLELKRLKRRASLLARIGVVLDVLVARELALISREAPRHGKRFR